jgi:low affinity Fe/Cu permease
MKNFFAKLATHTAHGLGHPFAFLLALCFILSWAALGPVLGYSERWQLLVNTGTTIITFLSVFLIQNSQNRESMAMQIKLDELINALKEARNEMIDLEDMPEEELKKLAEQFRRKGLTEKAAQDTLKSIDKNT